MCLLIVRLESLTDDDGVPTGNAGEIKGVQIKTSCAKFCFPHNSSGNDQSFKTLVSTPQDAPLIMGVRKLKDPSISDPHIIYEQSTIWSVSFFPEHHLAGADSCTPAVHIAAVLGMPEQYKEQRAEAQIVSIILVVIMKCLVRRHNNNILCLIITS